MYNIKGISVIVPIYNEEKNIAEVIRDLKKELSGLGTDYEIIAVNDGSSDSTGQTLDSISGIKTLKHPYNKGYGAALKTGLRQARFDWVLFFDADGQHQAGHIKEFIKYTDEYDLIAGDRSKSKYVRPNIRKPGLWLLKKVANYLVSYKIPDLNCGFRMIKKVQLKKHMHLMPDGFSMSTTTTLAFLKAGHNVKFLPIEVRPRKNKTKSTVKPGDAITTLILIIRLIILFSPLRIFAPLSMLVFLIGIVSLIYDLIKYDISETTVFVLFTSLLTFTFGLTIDQISELRRNLNK